MIHRESAIQTEAVYSDDEKYRYYLTKIWDPNKPRAVFIGINPSDATELIMDKTVMLLMNYLIRHEYGSVEIVNLFAYRSKIQDGLIHRSDRFEQANIVFVQQALVESELVIVGWGRGAGNNSKYREEISRMEIELWPIRDRVKCFQDTKGNVNCHISMGYSDAWKLVEYPF